jgi:hypothetical protein
VLTTSELPLAEWAVSSESRNRLQNEVCNRLLAQADEVIRAALQGLVGDVQQQLPELLQARRSIDFLMAANRETQDRIVQHPSFRYWLQAVRRSSGEGRAGHFEDFISRAGDFAWAAEVLTAGSTRPWNLRTDHLGGLRCASSGRYIELGLGYADQSVRLSASDSVIDIRCGDGLVVRMPVEDLVSPTLDDEPTLDEHGYQIRIFPIAAGLKTEVSSRDPWLRVQFTGTNQRTDGTEFFGAADDIYPPEFDLTIVKSAFADLERYWPAGREDVCEFTRTIVPITSPPNTFRAFTVRSRQGAIYLGPAPVDESVEMLLHECAHIKLRQVQLLDPLLIDPLDESFKVRVPWRPDPRPVPGILEGLYVFSHVAEYRVRRHVADGSRSAEDVTSLLADLAYASSMLRSEARLTPAGTEFLASMDGWIGRIEERVRSNG